MGTQERQTTRIYDENLQALVDPKYNLAVNQGGTSSTKTYSICQLLKDVALINKRGLLISILSHSVPHLKMGAIRDMQSIFEREEVDWNYNSTDKILDVGKSQVEFLSADKMKAHGGRRDILFVNEANGIEFEVFRQMFIRTRLMTFIDFNPTMEFWYHTEIKPYPKQYPHAFIHSTYKDNPFLDPVIKHSLDNAKKGTNYYRVYIEGLTGITEGAIYTDWKDGTFDNTLPYAFGVDFGHTDPDAVVRVAVDNNLKKVYVEEIYYEIGNGTEQIIKDIVNISDEADSRCPAFVCDTASSKIIFDLRAKGINIPYFAKPKIIDRIRKLQDYTIVICGQSPNLRREIANYIWNDKKAGVPIDMNNHLLDALGYVFWWLTNKTGLIIQERNM